MIYRGGQSVAAIYRGGQPVQRVYRGADLLWEDSPPWLSLALSESYVTLPFDNNPLTLMVHTFAEDARIEGRLINLWEQDAYSDRENYAWLLHNGAILDSFSGNASATPYPQVIEIPEMEIASGDTLEARVQTTRLGVAVVGWALILVEPDGRYEASDSGLAWDGGVQGGGLGWVQRYSHTVTSAGRSRPLWAVYWNGWYSSSNYGVRIFLNGNLMGEILDSVSGASQQVLVCPEVDLSPGDVLTFESLCDRANTTQGGSRNSIWMLM